MRHDLEKMALDLAKAVASSDSDPTKEQFLALTEIVRRLANRVKDLDEYKHPPGG